MERFNFPEAVATFFDERPEIFERLRPYLNAGQVHPEAVPETIEILVDDIVCGVLSREAVNATARANQNSPLFEVQFDEKPVYVSVYGHEVLNRIQNFAEFDQRLADGLSQG